MLFVVLVVRSFGSGNFEKDFRFPMSAKCCEAMDQLACQQEVQRNRSERRPVCILSAAFESNGQFSIPNIHEFAKYQGVVMSAYAEVNNYNYFLSIQPLHSKSVDDPRWHKIEILRQALDPSMGVARGSDYLVWIDADAIILDFDLRIEKICEQFPHADLIASSDIRMGLINTGFLILRNNAWASHFLSRWWTVADRSTVCDQDAFDILFSVYADEEKQQKISSDSKYSIFSRIKILPMETLNSHPPAMKYQQPSNQVVHLMGEHTSMRVTSFRHALSSICNHSRGSKLPPQLGLTRSFLQETALLVYENETRHWMDTCSKNECGVAEFEELSKSAHHLCDVLTLQGSPSAHEKILVLRRDIFVKLTANLQKMTTGSDGYVPVTLELLHLLKRAAEAGNDLFFAATVVEEKKSVANKVLVILQDLLNSVADVSKHVPLHMMALMYQSLGKLDYQFAIEINVLGAEANADHIWQRKLSYLRSAQSSLRRSVVLFDSINLKYDQSSNREHLESIQNLAAALCIEATEAKSLLFGNSNVASDHSLQESMNNFDEALLIWIRAVEKARLNMRGVEVGIDFDTLASVLHNSAVCHFHADQLSVAHAHVSEALMVRSQINEYQGKLATESPTVDLSSGLLSTIERQLSHLNSRLDTSSQSEPTKRNLVVKTLNSGVDISPLAMVIDENEWEECEVGQEGCEAFVLYDDDSSPLPLEPQKLPIDEELDRLDLLDMRGLYAQQSSRYTFNAEAMLMSGGDTEEDEDMNEVRQRYRDLTYSIERDCPVAEQVRKLELQIQHLMSRVQSLEEILLSLN